MLSTDEISVVIHNIHALDVMCAAQWVIRSSYINVTKFANTRENYKQVCSLTTAVETKRNFCQFVDVNCFIGRQL